jgi:hypothetical protein
MRWSDDVNGYLPNAHGIGEFWSLGCDAGKSAGALAWEFNNRRSGGGAYTGATGTPVAL